MTALEELRDFLAERYDTVDGAGACDRPSGNDWMKAGLLLEAVEREQAKFISNTHRWIPVGEQMPPARWPTDDPNTESIEVLFVDGDGDVWAGWYEIDEKEWFGKGVMAGGYVSGVSHWMPLPEAPK